MLNFPVFKVEEFLPFNFFGRGSVKSAVRLPPTVDERDAAREKERAKPYGVRTSVA